MHPFTTAARAPFTATVALALLVGACGPSGSLPGVDGSAGDGGRDARADTALDGGQDDAAQSDGAADAPAPDAPAQHDAQSDTQPAFGCYGFLITEFQTQGASGDADELIEIGGPVGADLSTLTLVYREAAGTTDVPLCNFSTGDSVPDAGLVVIASSGWTGGDAGVQALHSYYTTTGKLSAVGGGIGLRNLGTLVDSVGYGTATNSFVQAHATAAPQANKSSSRTPRCKSTGDNSADFSWTNPTPGKGP